MVICTALIRARAADRHEDTIMIESRYRAALRYGTSLFCLLPMAAFSQSTVSEITGYWDAMLTEEFRIRLYGPEPGEIDGLPLNDKGREAALNFDPN
jgi:hypothetical protein